MIASLAAIAVIVVMVFKNQHESDVAHMRVQGVNLVRTLSAVPYDQLTPGGEQQGAMQVLRHSASHHDFAYISVVDMNGRAANEIAADGVIVPASVMSMEPAAWLGEKQLTLEAGGREVIEFHAPLLDSADLVGFVRLGYFYPEFGLGVKQLPFLASMALAVFLLVPLFYVLIRMEVRPIRNANLEIRRMMEGDGFRRLEVAATGELGDFMRRFNRFAQEAHDRIEALEEDQRRLVTSSKLLTYRKSRVETVLETLPEAVLILDESGAITFANQKLAALFNVPREAILAQPAQQWCDNSDVLQLLMKHQTSGNARSLSDTIRFKVDLSAQREVATKTYPLFSPKNPSQTIGTLIVFKDETQEALARQARTDFVGHLAHELKSPLNVLALYSESLLADAGNDREFRIEAANAIAVEVDRLSSLTTGLLSMTQIETGSLTPERSLVRLIDVASAAFEGAQLSAMSSSMAFEFEAPKEMSPVYVDKDLIRIAIDNLLSNAVKYNQDEGAVQLTISETDDAIQIRVADTGIGISQEDEARIFEKFYRSSDSKVQGIGGHGLGLALTKQIIELHHGTLSVNRDREVGVEFIVNLWKESTTMKQAI